MNRHFQVPHHAIGWLLIGAVWTVAPILLRGPVSLLLVVLLLLGWRWQLARGRLSMPSRPLRIALLLVLVLLTLWHYHTIFGPDAGTALLAAAFALKMLEMFRLRDAYVVLLLGYFVLAMTFLFQMGPLITLYVVAGFILLTAALIGINQADDQGHAWQHLKLSGLLFLQSLPLLLVSFVVVPRVAPLWGLGLQSDQARTGLSSSMSPGSISDISQSSDPVFRVEFQGHVPPPSARYWRGLIYSWFDGRTWKQAMTQGLPDDQVIQYPGDKPASWYQEIRQEALNTTPDYRYRVLLEPTGRRWLFALGVPLTNESDIGLARDYRLVHRDPVDQMIAYRVASYTHLQTDASLPDWLRQLNLSLPPEVDPETRAMAKRWRAESASDQAYIRKVLQWFHDQHFYYTLHPPKLSGENTIDEFLFQSRRGFCAHYASAFAFMMRVAGIPARIVAGYQGGEMNALGHYLQVRQYDAHAWVEVWLSGRGWVREDPTAAVAPNRIEDGLLSALQTEGDDGVGSLVWQNTGLLKRISMLGDYVSYVWQRWVLDYNQGSQSALLERWFGKGNWLYWVLGGLAVVLVLMAAIFWWMKQQWGKQLSPWQKEYRKLFHALRKRGLSVNPAQSPSYVIARAGQTWPEKREAFDVWLEIYTRLAYGWVEDVHAECKALKHAWPLRSWSALAGLREGGV